MYKIKLGYSAGLSADIRSILSGDINAALNLKFFFFSKTFRQRLFVRPVDMPAGKSIRFAHYPYGPQRQNRMYYSEGVVGDRLPPFTNTYTTNASLEPGSSGAGVYEIMQDGLVGVVVSENAPPPPPAMISRPG